MSLQGQAQCDTQASMTLTAPDGMRYPLHMAGMSLTFPEFSGPIAMPNSVRMKVLLMRFVISLKFFP